MTISSSCILCNRSKIVTAEKKQWNIHLASHREDIIRYITDNFAYCVICTYGKPFDDKSQAAAHLRWAHKRSELIDWYFNHLFKMSTYKSNS